MRPDAEYKKGEMMRGVMEGILEGVYSILLVGKKREKKS